MSYRCPKCHREIYNRRSRTCGYYGAEIPAEFRFTDEEMAALDQRMEELEQSRQKRARQKAKEEEENSGGPDAGFIMPIL